MNSKIFISWSGDLSQKLAEEISEWLPRVLQFAKPYFTPNDIEKGTRWSTDIANELENAKVGIVCLTKENINRPWILFEAGALSKNLGNSNVCTILFDFDSSQLTGPLTSFQATKFEKEDFKKLIKVINSTAEESKLNESVLDEVFEVWWPRLEQKVNEILNSTQVTTNSVERTEKEILKEILNLTRQQSRSARPIEDLVITEKIIKKMMDTVIDVHSLLLNNIKDGKGVVYPTQPFIFIHEINNSLMKLCSEIDKPLLYREFMRKIDKDTMIEFTGKEE